MFCPNCGQKITEEAEFCPFCGFKIIKSAKTTTEEMTEKTNKLKNNIKTFLQKYKKEFKVVGVVFLLLFLFYFGYKILLGEKLSWDETYEDNSLEYVLPNEVTLGVVFSNEDKINDLKVTSTCGTVTQNKLEFVWNLKDSLGECHLTVQYKLRKIDKKIIVITDDDKSLLGLPDFVNTDDEDADPDLDGLTNKEEKEHQTNPLLADSDMDGLDDYYEIYESKTDPLKKDTDNDGLNDYDEIELGLDPNKADSKGDGLKDGERTVSYTFKNEEEGLTVTLTGKGNLPSSSITTFKNSTFTDMDGVLETVYNFYTPGNMDKAVVTLSYATLDLEAKKINEDNLTLYYFNDETKELKAVDTKMNKEKKEITVTLNHFSKYVLGDSQVVTNTKPSQILMVLDNSGSMYSEEQLKAQGFSGTSEEGNDPDFKRITLTKHLIDMFTGNYTFGISEFAGNYLNIADFTDNKEEAKEATENIRHDLPKLSGGTKIVNALTKGIDAFKDDKQNHYLIILTDGQDTSYFDRLSKNVDTIVKKAQEKDVKICAIGLGKNVDKEELTSIAEQTGCHYYPASEEKALDEIYSLMGKNINYSLIDTNNDGTTNATEMVDSGFIVSKNGFSFENYKSNLVGGHCYGMATFAELYYTKTLPLKHDAKTVSQKKTLLSSEDVTSYPYDLTNTYFKNYDNLYDYKPTTNALKYALGFKVFNEEKPKNYRYIANNQFLYNEEFKKGALASGLYDVSLQDVDNSSYKQLENLLLNEDRIQTSDKIDENEKELLNAIYMSFLKQNVTKFYISSSNSKTWGQNLFGIYKTEKLPSAAFVELLKTRLQNGDAPVIAGDFDGGYHGVNAISLAQDNNDANHYYIGVYDNNFPGEKRYIEMTCTKKSCVTKANDNYNSSEQPIFISASLEEDLKYFQ